MPRQKPSRPQKTVPANKAAPLPKPSVFGQAIHDLRQPTAAYPNVSGRWLLQAAAVIFGLALGCAWLTLCLLYWQGSWQLLYHPQAAITRSPASLGLAFEPVKFAATETGVTQLTGWWIPAESSHFTVLYLHGADGNLSDTVDALAALHRQNLSVFAIDYRGYGLSQVPSAPIRPSEKQLRQDAEWALSYLTLNRALAPKTIVIFGSGLGANVAAELAADHNELAGIVLDQPLEDPMALVFNDSRSRLVPAHSIVKDRYDLVHATSQLRIPSLWLFARSGTTPESYKATPTQKSAAWLTAPVTADPNFPETLNRWLDTQ